MAGEVRRFWVVVHRWTGLTIAAFLIVVGLTGSLLAFYSELDTILNPDLLTVRARDAPRLDLDALAVSVERSLPQAAVTGLSLSQVPWRSVSASVEGRRDAQTGTPAALPINEAFVDPYDGTYLGGRNNEKAGLGARHLMAFIYSIHYSLHLPGAWGVWLMGGVAILWFVDNFVGAYLTFPLKHGRNPGRPPEVKQRLSKSWRSRWLPAWKVKTSGSSYRLIFDLHRAPGLWFWAMLGILALSSIYLNLAREVFNPVIGFFATVTPFPENFPKQKPAPSHLPFSKAVDAARAALPPGARDLRLSFIGLDGDINVFRVGFGYADTKKEWFELRQENVFLDGTTGRLIARHGSESATGAGDKFNALLFPLHSGQILGLPGRILICVTGLVIAGLSVTGVLLWWRKARARRSVASRVRVSNAAMPQA